MSKGAEGRRSKGLAPKEALTQREPIDVFPQGGVLLSRYEKDYGASPESVETMRAVLYAILDKQLEHADVFRSTANGAEFPYTSVSVREIAEGIFAAEGGVKQSRAEEESAQPATAARHVFLFTGFPADTSSGSPFDWDEMAIHAILRQLPAALVALREGHEVSDHVFYTLGYPTNEYGRVTDELQKEMKTDTVGALGRLTAEFIASKLPAETEASAPPVNLTGISLGSSIAAVAASELVKNGVATQEGKSTPGTSSLRLALYVPVGASTSNESVLRAGQVAGGFVGEELYRGQVNKREGKEVVADTEPEFRSKVRALLAKRMPVQMDAEQTSKKRSGILLLGKAVAFGTPLPEGIKGTQIIGLHDPLMYRTSRVEEAEAHRTAHPAALLKGLLERDSTGMRKLGIDMPHLIPFYRANEFKRFDGVVKAVKGDKAGTVSSPVN